MSTPKIPDALCIEALEAMKKAKGNQIKAAEILGISRGGLQGRLQDARRRGLDAQVSSETVTESVLLKDRVRTLEAMLRERRQDELDAEKVRSAIIKLSAQTPEPPAWLAPKKIAKQAPGVPSLFLSDLHWGEVVDPTQIGGVNEYNIEIAQRRLRECITRAIYLLKQHVVNPDFPGIVLILGGDMLSGDIHEELSATNEMEIMPTFVDLFGVMVWAIRTLADQFGRVFIPCVTGNHGRNTKKIRAKGRNFTSFDWLLYVMLEKHFADDKRISFMIPNGPDALFSVYGHRYLLTHGDEFFGGDSQIGAIGPITRGNKRKLARNTAINQDYDTMLLGHWHQYMPLHRTIVNGSLKGYDEYANSRSFDFEPPTQALWITHPEHGITISMPIYLDQKKRHGHGPWVSWKAE